jgi:hypothetical protein
MSKKETVGAFLGAVLTNDPATMRELANANYVLSTIRLSPQGWSPLFKCCLFYRKMVQPLRIFGCSKMEITSLCITFGKTQSLLVQTRWCRLILSA